MRITILTTVLATVLVSTSIISAQDYAIRPANYGPRAIYRHASTFEEGVLRGTADVLRGMGDYNYSTSLALVNREEARSRFIDNRLKSTQAYFEMRRINRKAVRLEKGPRPTSQDAIRYAKMRKPQALDAYQYEPALRALFWPATLKTAAFTPEREAVDKLIAERTVEKNGVGSEFHHKVTELSNRMIDKLQTKIRDMTPTEYVAAKKFLVGLEREAEMYAGAEGIATK